MCCFLLAKWSFLCWNYCSRFRVSWYNRQMEYLLLFSKCVQRRWCNRNFNVLSSYFSIDSEIRLSRIKDMTQTKNLEFTEEIELVNVYSNICEYYFYFLPEKNTSKMEIYNVQRLKHSIQPPGILNKDTQYI